jgi:uncharacterized protein YggE
MIEKFQRQLEVGGWLLVAVLALGALLIGSELRESLRGGSPSENISVSGQGKITAKPDVAVLDLSITEEGATADGAQEKANLKSKAVVAYLEDAGVEEKDIRTSGYNISPQYDYTLGRSRITGYQVSQSMTVKVRDLDDANDILDGVVAAGANNVNGFSFTIDDPELLKDQAREEAIADAKDKAEVLADQLGVRLGSIVSFSEDVGGWPMPMFMKSAEMAVDGRGGFGGGGPSLPEGENEVTVNVTIVYKIK